MFTATKGYIINGVFFANGKRKYTELFIDANTYFSIVSICGVLRIENGRLSDWNRIVADSSGSDRNRL